MRQDDAFWAARIVARFSDAAIRALVEKGRYSDPAAAEAIIATLIKPRDRIKDVWLTGINPVVNPALSHEGELRFDNATLMHGVAGAPDGYTLRWSRFDNTTDTHTPVGGEALIGDSRALVPAGVLAGADYVAVSIATRHPDFPTWAPVQVYFRRTGVGWQTVGIDRAETPGRHARPPQAGAPPLDAGAVVSRTAGTLRRYHGKMMIVDRRLLHVYGFNYTRLDYKSRSFGVITANRTLVEEALKPFDADATRRPYIPGCRDFVVSPENSRERLSTFIRGAKRELLIYDPRLSDEAIHQLLTQRSHAGIDVRIIGRTHRLNSTLPIEKYPGRRLHVRAIIRDRVRAFVGSQSLGRVALDHRRELGVIVNDETVVREMRAVFQHDWRRTRGGRG